MDNTVTYIASPYTGTDYERVQRYKDVEKYAAHIIQEGEVAVSPIVHNHILAGRYQLPREFDFWQNYCMTLLGACDYMHVLMLDGWKESVGVTAEIKLAHELLIPVLYIDAETYEEVSIPAQTEPKPDDREIYDEMDGSAAMDASVEDLY